MTDRSKLVVSGHKWADWHMDEYQAVKVQALRRGLKATALGGGRIEHYPKQGVVSVYGHSKAFGPAVHEVSAALVQKWFPLYNNITV